MKSLTKSTLIYTGVALVFGLALGWFLFGNKQESGLAHEHEIVPELAQVWTCSMHPSVRQPEQGKCPICGMDLIPLVSSGTENNSFDIRMSDNAVKLAQIRTTTVKVENPVKELRLTGKLRQMRQRRTHKPLIFPAGLNRCL